MKSCWTVDGRPDAGCRTTARRAINFLLTCAIYERRHSQSLDLTYSYGVASSEIKPIGSPPVPCYVLQQVRAWVISSQVHLHPNGTRMLLAIICRMPCARRIPNRVG